MRRFTERLQAALDEFGWTESKGGEESGEETSGGVVPGRHTFHIHTYSVKTNNITISPGCDVAMVCEQTLACYQQYLNFTSVCSSCCISDIRVVFYVS